MIDVKKILQFDYLNAVALQLRNNILDEKKKIIKLYDLDSILNLEENEINDIFKYYELSYENILKLKYSSFLDESWEFADLYSDDLSYSLEQKEQLREEALKEVVLLNKKIDIINQKINGYILTVEKNLSDLENFINLLNSDSEITNISVDSIKEFILHSSLLKGDERFKASLVVVKHLINSKRKIVFGKEIVDTAKFEQLLDNVYESSEYEEKPSEEDKINSDLPYFDVVMHSYERYKNLIDEMGYGDKEGYNNLLVLMDDVSNLSGGIEDSMESMSKDDFCIRLAELLYQLNYMNGADFVEDALVNLARLDSLYDVDSKFIKYKQDLLKKLDKFFEIVLVITETSSVEKEIKNRLRNRIKLLQNELENNMISEKRKKEIDVEYDKLTKYIENLSENVKCVIEVEQTSERARKILSYNKKIERLEGDDYNKLVELLDKLSRLKNEVLENGVNEELSLELVKCKDNISEIELKLKSNNQQVMPKVNLRGFVLFDFDEDNKTYVVTDLDPSNKDKLIDKSIEIDKLNKGYDSYCKLIRDLHLIGNTEKLANNDSHGYNTDRLNEPVYRDVSSRTHDNTTGMYRLKYDRNGVERFVEQKVV